MRIANMLNRCFLSRKDVMFTVVLLCRYFLVLVIVLNSDSVFLCSSLLSFVQFSPWVSESDDQHQSSPGLGAMMAP